MTEKLLVPDIGDFENVEVIELLVKEGQDIKKNDPVVTIESDKSSVEIPSIFSGKVESVNVKVGYKVSKGDLLINISSNSDTPSNESNKDLDNLQNLVNSLNEELDKKNNLLRESADKISAQVNEFEALENK